MSCMMPRAPTQLRARGLRLLSVIPCALNSRQSNPTPKNRLLYFLNAGSNRLVTLWALSPVGSSRTQEHQPGEGAHRNTRRGATPVAPLFLLGALPRLRCSPGISSAPRR